MPEIIDEKSKVAEADSQEVDGQEAEVIGDDLLSELSEQEREMATKQGLVAKKSEEKQDKKQEEKQDALQQKKKEKEAVVLDDDLSPEEEHKKLNTFNANEKALYWKHKKERIKRQAIEREKELLEIKLKVAEKQKSDATQETKTDVASDDRKQEPIDLFDTGEYNDDEGQLDKDKSRYLTEKDLEAHEKKKLDESIKRQEEVQKIRQHLNIVEAEARTKYPDFDNVVGLALEVVRGQIKTSAKVRRLYRDYVEIVTNPNVERDETAADIAYEIGKLHPNYKPGGNQPSANPAKLDGGSIQKIVDNSTRRVSSASVNSGGSASVGEDDITIEMAANMKPEQYAKLSPATRKRLLTL